MIKKDIDWPYLKVTALWFLVSALITTSCWYASYHYMNTNHTALKKTQRENSNIRHQISVTKKDAHTIRQFQGAYNLLIKGGLIGNEHRLSWISSLRAISSQLKLKSSRFQLTPRTTAEPQLIRTDGLLKVHKSRMKISLELPHEVDLLRVLAALEKQPGYYSANYCSIKRNTRKIILLANATNFTVLCDLDWYSFNAKNNNGANDE